MGNRIKEKIRKLESVRDNIQKETGNILNRYKRQIIDLNKNQFTDGYGSDNRNLFNVQREFDGVYAPGYKKQGLYDFYETGAFIRGMFVTVNKNRFKVDSSGKGSGDKSVFFSGYTNLFGLNDYSMEKLRKLIAPELKKYIKEKSRL